MKHRSKSEPIIEVDVWGKYRPIWTKDQCPWTLKSCPVRGEKILKRDETKKRRPKDIGVGRCFVGICSILPSRLSTQCSFSFNHWLMIMWVIKVTVQRSSKHLVSYYVKNCKWNMLSLKVWSPRLLGQSHFYPLMHFHCREHYTKFLGFRCLRGFAFIVCKHHYRYWFT